MKKIIIVAIAFAALFAEFVFAAKPKAKDKSGTTEIIEHKGSAWGVEIPDWTKTVLMTPNQKTLKKALGLSDMKIWVLTKSGRNLDFLQTWVDQVDARAEIAASIKQVIGDRVKAHMSGSSDDREIEKTIERESERIAAASVVGLEKETDWWTCNRHLKPGVKKGKENDDYILQYTYMVIYAMNESLFKDQLTQAFKNMKDDLDVTDALVATIAEDLIGQTQIRTPDAD